MMKSALTINTHAGTSYAVAPEMCELAAAGGELKAIVGRLKPLADALVAAIEFAEAAPLLKAATPDTCRSAYDVAREELVVLSMLQHELADGLDRYGRRLADAAMARQEKP